MIDSQCIEALASQVLLCLIEVQESFNILREEAQVNNAPMAQGEFESALEFLSQAKVKLASGLYYITAESEAGEEL